MCNYTHPVVTYTKGIENESNSQRHSVDAVSTIVVTYTKGIENESNSQHKTNIRIQ